MILFLPNLATFLETKGGAGDMLANALSRGEVRALGRPLRGVGHAHVLLRQLLGLAAGLVHEPDLVLAAAVGDESDLLPVGGPAGALVVGPGGGGQALGC